MKTTPARQDRRGRKQVAKVDDCMVRTRVVGVRLLDASMLRFPFGDDNSRMYIKLIVVRTFFLFPSETDNNVYESTVSNDILQLGIRLSSTSILFWT